MAARALVTLRCSAGRRVYQFGVFHGPVRAWHPDGRLKSNDYRHHSSRPPPEGPAEPVIDIDLDEMQSLELKDRSLLVAYERHSLRFSNAFASRLIQAKILGEVCIDAYRGRVDHVVFQSIRTKLVDVVPYSSS